MPDVAGLIAYRQPDGHVAVAVSRRLAGAFHPAAARTSTR